MADSATKKRINQLIRDAQRAGDVVRARELVQQALDLDPSSEKANLWMATIQDDKDRREYYIQRVLEINPRNRIAPYLRQVRTPEERMAEQQPQENGSLGSPRQLSRTLILFSVFSLVVVGVMVFMRVRQYQQDTYLAENGLHAIATITGKSEIEDDDSIYYSLHYSFDAQYEGGLVPFEDVTSAVPEAVYQVLQVGDRYEVTYLPEDPTVAQLTKLANPPALQEQFTRELILFVVLGTLPVDIGMVIWIINRQRKANSVAESGQ